MNEAAQGDAPAAGLHGHAQGVVETVGPDLEASLAFYRALGFEVARRSGPFAALHWRGLRLFLAEDAGAPTAPRWTQIRLMAEDVDALHAAVRAAGIEPLHPPRDRPYGLREFVVRDPNGVDLRFAQALR
ncbi:VOC family protein [Vulcaniibacterium tengchongense]|uniref:Putative glyoxalase superfamily protein PhnB n=1 Tax=Vulcaniibacterium tengchongense TaxID=1273429 RepID=A0A3N4VEW5_9GAMM|nr:VOC family protein [Vulcaniibacterium tengchongense]RPE81522.1 putative glyoxalase superfamily protein PhnB [Vulcaniibacterium tengchongense]